MLERFRSGVALAPYATLRAGGEAERFFIARSVEDVAEAALFSQKSGMHSTVLGSGSNVLPSDDGVPGLTVINLANAIAVKADGEVTAACGCSFQDLFLKTVQAGFRGLEFAVGIPGSLGGALVSNAGAYRSNISEFLVGLEVVFQSKRTWVEPSFMEFSYRDSILRRPDPPQCALLQARFVLPKGDRKASFDEARDYQRQRIGKQPAPASAGSFFKNVLDKDLAMSLDNMPARLKEAGVVPAGYLIENVGLRGFRHEDVMIAPRHANFLINVGGAKATAIRRLAEHAKTKVYEKYGVTLEEEVLYLGDWSRYKPTKIA